MFILLLLIMCYYYRVCILNEYWVVWIVAVGDKELEAGYFPRAVHVDYYRLRAYVAVEQFDVFVEKGEAFGHLDLDKKTKACLYIHIQQV